MIAVTEQRIPWLRGERRSAGAAGAVAARDQPQMPRRPLPEQLPRARKAALLVVALGLLVGAVALFLGPLADRCGPVGDVKRCGDRPSVPVTSSGKPWTAAFESVVPASGGATVSVLSPVVSPDLLAPNVVGGLESAPTVVAPAPAVSPKPATALRRPPAKAKAPVRRAAQESRESRTTGRESSEDESAEPSSESEDE